MKNNKGVCTMKLEIEGTDDQVKDMVMRIADSYRGRDWTEKVEEESVYPRPVQEKKVFVPVHKKQKSKMNRGNTPGIYKYEYTRGKNTAQINAERTKQGLPIWVDGKWVPTDKRTWQQHQIKNQANPAKAVVEHANRSDAMRKAWVTRKAALSQKYQTWTADEDKFLNENYRKMIAGDIAKQLHRTIKSIYSRAVKLGLQDAEQSKRAHEAYMKQNHPFVPKSFDKQRIELAQAAIKHKPSEQMREHEPRVELPRFPTLKGLGVGVSDEVVFHIFGQFFNVTKELSFTKDSSVLGISDLREWANFITDVMMKRKEICNCMGVEDSIKVKGLALVC